MDERERGYSSADNGYGTGGYGGFGGYGSYGGSADTADKAGSPGSRPMRVKQICIFGPLQIILRAGIIKKL